MTTLETIGKNVAELRKKAGITQEDLAGMAEIDRSYLSEIENGHKNMSILSLLKIAEALKIKPSKFLDD